MRVLRSFIILPVILCASGAAHAQTRPVPMNTVPYGPGRLDASQILEHGGQDVSACGRVGNVDPANQVIVIAGLLRVYLRPGMDAQSLWGTVACATGLVEVRRDGGFTFAVIQNLERIDVIGGTGPYVPPQPQCGPGQMADPSAGGCVKRWRASPY